MKQARGYFGRNLLVVLLWLMPVLGFLLVAGPGSWLSRNGRADRIVIHPHQTLTIEAEGQIRRLDLHKGSIPLPQDRSTLLRINVGDAEFQCRGADEKWAFSSSPVRRTLLRALGFETTDAPGQPPLLIVRPWRGGDDNPLAPYVTEVELLILLVLSVVSIVGLLILRARRR